MSKYIARGSEWSIKTIEKFDFAFSQMAEGYQLDTFPCQIEIVSSEQMMDAYSYIGMPLGYHHWTFGKHYLEVEQSYRRGAMDLAYELVINSNPCLVYLMEENTLTMQATVIAHACYGHNSFFKGNYLFKDWTAPDFIIDYLIFAKSYISQCESKHGYEAVEEILDACHALMNYGVDRYKHPAALSLEKERAKQKKRAEYLQTQVNNLWKTLPAKQEQLTKAQHFPEEPEENILYFIEKNAPLLEPWQREIVRITRKIAQYFYPQRQTKVMNEGWACFWHYILINDLYQSNQVDQRFMLEFIQSHSSVIFQAGFDDPRYNGINPYTLGFNLFSEIKRICSEPTAEDKAYFPEMVQQNWLSTVHFAMENFKDESFIAQFLTPHMIREMKLFTLLDDDHEDALEISAIHDEVGYQHIRETLSQQYNLAAMEPDLHIFNVDVKGDRALTLRYTSRNRRVLNPELEEVMKYLHSLWGFSVKLESLDENGQVTLVHECPPPHQLSLGKREE